MKKWALPLLVVGVAASGVAAVRAPAVAGGFYPAAPDKLRSQVQSFVSAAGESTPSAVALVVPHAGYEYSGAVAGRGFAALRRDVRRVVLLGPSHHRGFAGGALPLAGVTAFATPLGEVPLDIAALAVLRGAADFGGPAAAHDREHCLEVELPFIQVLAPNAAIVPVLIGATTDRDTARRVARSLAGLLDDHTAVVVSSDFTHWGAAYGWTPFERGPELGATLLALGRVTAGRIAAIDPRGFAQQVRVSGDTVCGARPIEVLLELLAGAFQGRGTVREVATSGQRADRWDLSVTYAAVTFEGVWHAMREPGDEPAGKGETVLTEEQQRQVLALVRATLRSHLAHDGALAQWYADNPVEGALAAPAGAFVTLHNTGERVRKEGRLRACMGMMSAREPVVDAVVHAAESAAHDPRFPELRLAELAEVELEVSVLSPLEEVASPASIVVGKHGVVLSKGGRSAVFLPQVATEQGWDRDTMLDHLAVKAGLPRDAWHHGATFDVFTAQVFGEGDS